VLSGGGGDAPRVLRRKLRDNIGRYTVEPIGVVHNTHRYRGNTAAHYTCSQNRR